MKKGFTLIELLVTASIIAIMAVIAIPSFDKYGKANDFNQKATLMKAEIEKSYALAMNPEQGRTTYQITVDTTNNKINLINSSETIESVSAPDGVTLATPTNTLTCNTDSKDYCCIAATCSTDPDYSANTSFFTMTSSDLNKTATFTISEKPFRVAVSGL